MTGGGTGLGRAISYALAEAGFAVALSYRRSDAAAGLAVEGLVKLGVPAIAVQADLAEAAVPARLVSEVAEWFGRLDVLVNNAAETARIPFEDLDALDSATWDRIQQVDLRAPFLMVRAATPWLKQARGSVINVASAAGLAPRGSCIAYSVAKAGLIHLTQCLGLALAPEVRVVAIAPGDLPTNWAGRAVVASSPADDGTVVDNEPLIRSVAELVVTAVGNHSLTGSVLVADRGVLLGLDDSRLPQP